MRGVRFVSILENSLLKISLQTDMCSICLKYVIDICYVIMLMTFGGLAYLTQYLPF